MSSGSAGRTAPLLPRLRQRPQVGAVCISISLQSLNGNSVSQATCQPEKGQRTVLGSREQCDREEKSLPGASKDTAREARRPGCALGSLAHRAGGQARQPRASVQRKEPLPPGLGFTQSRPRQEPSEKVHTPRCETRRGRPAGSLRGWSLAPDPRASRLDSPGGRDGRSRPGPGRMGARRVRNGLHRRTSLFFRLQPSLPQGESQALGASGRGQRERAKDDGPQPQEQFRCLKDFFFLWWEGRRPPGYKRVPPDSSFGCLSL